MKKALPFSEILRHDLYAKKAASISSLTISVAAGAVDSVINFQIPTFPITNQGKGSLGFDGDTSLSIASGVFTEEVAYGTPDDELTTGQFYVDYQTGQGRGKKATTGTSISASWSYFLSAESEGALMSLDSPEWQRYYSSALERKNTIKNAPAKLLKARGTIDATETSGVYYVQFFNKTSDPVNGDTALVGLPIQHVTGTITQFSLNLLPLGVKGSSGLSFGISTTQFTMTLTANSKAALEVLYSSN